MKKTIISASVLASLAFISCESKKDYTCTCSNPSSTNVFTQVTETEIKEKCDDFYKGNPVATTTCKSEVK